MHSQKRISWLLAALMLAGATGTVFAAGPGGGEPAAPTAEQLAAAATALKKAQSDEAALREERSSREMARSATREIAKAEKIKLDAANKAKQSADRVVGELTAELKGTEEAAAKSTAEDKAALQQLVGELRSDLDELKQFAAEKVALVDKAAKRYAVEQDLFDRSQATLDATDIRIAEAILKTHSANVRLLELRHGAAQAEAQTATAQAATAKAAIEGKSGDEKTAAEKTCAECDKAAKAANEKCRAAQKTMVEAEFIASLDQLAFDRMQRDRRAALAARKGTAAGAARKQAAAATDAAAKKTHEEAAAAAAAEQTEALSTVAKLDAAILQGDARRFEILARMQGGLEPLAPQEWDRAKARHLLVRAGFGGTPQQVEELFKMGLHKAVDHLVDYAFLPAPNLPFDALAPEKPDLLANFAAKTRIPGAAGRIGTRRLTEDAQFAALRHWWLRRMVESPRQLQEKLTLFWHGHFATQQSVVRHAYNMYQQNQLFREHAAGNFGPLLYGIVHDPAMLRYLDNHKNVKGEPNENLAREILELFAMGEGRGYTEQDIVEAARALTGYTFDHFSGEFRFIHAQHDTSDKTVFGKTGPWTGDDLVMLILEQPATSRWIASRLYSFFAQQNADAEAVERLASVLRTNDFEVSPMLKNLFLSRQFYSAEVMGSQIKCPVQLVVGTLRDMGVKQATDPAALERAIRSMGQDLFEPPDVKGWRYGRNWISSNRVLTRYNTVSELIRSVPQPGNRRGVDVIALLERGRCETAEGIVDALSEACLAAPLPEAKRNELIDFLRGMPAVTEWDKQRDLVNGKLQQLLVLIMSTPEYQLG